MIKDENIMDLSDFAERDIKEEFANLKDSISAIEKLIEAKEQEMPGGDNSALLASKIKTSIRENIEEMSLPVEAKCDALEAKLNVLQESVNEVRNKQDTVNKMMLANTIIMGILLLIGLYIFFLFYVG